MTPLSRRDKKALLILGVVVLLTLLLQFGLPIGQERAVVSSSSLDRAEKRVWRLQEVARQKPRAAAEAEGAARALAETEKGLLKAATPALASAEMQQLMKDLLRGQGINMQSSEFGVVKAVGDSYAQAPLTVVFACGIDQWINLMAALRNAPQVISTLDLRIAPGDMKTKSLHVRMIVAGYIPAALLSGAKGAAGQ